MVEGQVEGQVKLIWPFIVIQMTLCGRHGHINNGTKWAIYVSERRFSATGVISDHYWNRTSYSLQKEHKNVTEGSGSTASTITGLNLLVNIPYIFIKKYFGKYSASPASSLNSFCYMDQQLMQVFRPLNNTSYL